MHVGYFARVSRNMDDFVLKYLNELNVPQNIVQEFKGKFLTSNNINKYSLYALVLPSLVIC